MVYKPLIRPYFWLGGVGWLAITNGTDGNRIPRNQWVLPGLGKKHPTVFPQRKNLRCCDWTMTLMTLGWFLLRCTWKTWMFFFQIALYIMVGDFQNLRYAKSSVNLAPFHGTPPASGFIKDCNESRPIILLFSVHSWFKINFQGIRVKLFKTVRRNSLPKFGKVKKIIILKSAIYWLIGGLCITHMSHERNIIIDSKVPWYGRGYASSFQGG